MSGTEAFAAKQRIDQGLEALRVELGPYVTRHMRDRYGDDCGAAVRGVERRAETWMSMRS